MARKENVPVFVVLLFVVKCSAFGLIDDLVGGSESCEDICQNTFPLHTYEKFSHLSVCQRGCRLFTIIDFIDEFSSPNETSESCISSCTDSYPKEDDAAACSVGCKNQFSTASNRRSEWEANFESPSFSPLVYINNMYSNFIDKVQNHISVSWSFYAGTENGELVVIKSQPVVLVEGPLEYKTSNYMETNLAAVDNSATPNLKSSQVLSARERDLGLYADDETATGEQSMDWLDCISKKSGLPRLFITFTLLASALAMIWLCASSAATAPDQRITTPKQKLSYYGDMDWAHILDEKKLLAHPQFDFEQAGPIPIKVVSERI